MLPDMDSITTAQIQHTTWSAHLPGWTLARGRDIDEIDAAFAAGIALKSLDDLIRANPSWLGCWRDRLALKSAAIAARMLGRHEGEDALRDAVLLTPENGDPGPAGKLFLATRRGRPGRSPPRCVRMSGKALASTRGAFRLVTGSAIKFALDRRKARLDLLEGKGLARR